MKVRITVAVDARDRWAISRRHGWRKPATHEQVARELVSLLRADLDEQRSECCGFHEQGGLDTEPCGPRKLGDDLEPQR